MSEIFSRTEMLLGPYAMKKLAACRVAIFGLGGVGGYVVEALVRSGIGAVDLVDHDKVDESNLNRQIIATQDTIGRYKVDVARERIALINPDCRVNCHRLFVLPEKEGELPQIEGVETAGISDFDLAMYDYVVDAIDTVAGKLALIQGAQAAGTPVISSMGTGNKLDASALKVADIYDTSVCPLAKVMRQECRKRGIDSLKVVYSEEEAIRPETKGADTGRKRAPGSVAFVPGTAGLIIAGEVIRDLAGLGETR